VPLVPNASSHAWALPPGWSSDDIDQDNSFTATTADVLGAAELCVTVYLGACSEAGCMTIDVGGPIGIDDADQGSTVWVSVHPNPSNGTFQLSFSGTDQGPLQLNIVDALGQVIQAWTTEPAQQALPIAMEHPPAGVYFLIASRPTEQQVVKLFITR